MKTRSKTTAYMVHSIAAAVLLRLTLLLRALKEAIGACNAFQLPKEYRMNRNYTPPISRARSSLCELATCNQSPIASIDPCLGVGVSICFA